ncbi:hypothetical protein [Arthrobacter sp. MDT1-65]
MIITETGLAPFDAVPVEEALLDLLLHPEAEEAFEWMVSVDGVCTDWRDLESRDQVVRLVRLLTNSGDWLVIQSKSLDHGPSGRYAQVMNTGSVYLVEVAYRETGAVYNWRIGLGAEADDAGNRPYSAITPIQQLMFAAVTEVLDSWLRGHGIPLGYGGALHVYK